jgi:molybdopterin-guanine dinucleotide biosynthesis protein A
LSGCRAVALGGTGWRSKSRSRSASAGERSPSPCANEELAISFCLSEGCGPRAPRISLRRKTALPVLERRLADGSLALHDALGEPDTTRVAVDSVLLANVNTPDELRRLR